MANRNLFVRVPPLFGWPCLLIGLLLVLGTIAPNGFLHLTEQLNIFIYNTFGGFYLWFTSLTLVVFLLIGVSPLGRIRLGGPDAKAEYSLISWFAMLFCAGMGTGLMFWGAAEPLYHYMNPPLINALSLPERDMQAMHYTWFHWGLHPWAIYGMSALAISFFGFNLNKGFRFSAFLGTDKRFVLDLFTILAIVFGVTATFGMGVLQIEGGLRTLLHWPQTPWLTLAILILVMLAYVASAIKGVRHGIQFLSRWNFRLYLVLLGVVVFLTPHSIQGLWDMLATLPRFFQHLPAMSMGWGHFTQPHWVRDWTVKYWSWWIAWAPFVGMFIAAISRGRTVRELVAASVILPTAFSMLWFALFGQAALALHNQGLLMAQSFPLPEANTVLFRMMQILISHPAPLWLCLAIIALDFINSADAATLTIARLSQREESHREPARVLRLAWGMLFAVLTGLFLMTGGMAILQEITLIWALPFSLLLGAVFISLIWAMVKSVPDEGLLKRWAPPQPALTAMEESGAP